MGFSAQGVGFDIMRSLVQVLEFRAKGLVFGASDSVGRLDLVGFLD